MIAYYRPTYSPNHTVTATEEVYEPLCVVLEEPIKEESEESERSLREIIGWWWIAFQNNFRCSPLRATYHKKAEQGGMILHVLSASGRRVPIRDLRSLIKYVFHRFPLMTTFSCRIWDRRNII